MFCLPNFTLALPIIYRKGWLPLLPDAAATSSTEISPLTDWDETFTDVCMHRLVGDIDCVWSRRGETSRNGEIEVNLIRLNWWIICWAIVRCFLSDGLYRECSDILIKEMITELLSCVLMCLLFDTVILQTLPNKGMLRGT